MIFFEIIVIVTVCSFVNRRLLIGFCSWLDKLYWLCCYFWFSVVVGIIYSGMLTWHLCTLILRDPWQIKSTGPLWPNTLPRLSIQVHRRSCKTLRPQLYIHFLMVECFYILLTLSHC